MRRLIIISLAALLLAGCRSSRHAQRQQDALPEETTSTITPTPAKTNAKQGKTSKQTARSTNVPAVSAKMSLRLTSGKKSIKCGGTYRVKRDEMVQINLTYTVVLVTLNVGTLELTPSGILLIDRMNKRYCQATYDDIPSLKKAGVTFQTLEAAFWGESDGEKGQYISCVISEWATLSQGRFPQEATLTMSGTDAYKADVSLSKIQETSDWEGPTAVPSGYEAVSVKTVMNAIMSATK